MNRNWIKFLLCVLLSFSIWMVLSFSNNYPEIESVAVDVRSGLEGRNETATESVVVSARCNTSGLNHLRLSRQRRPVRLYVDPSDLEYVSGDSYRIPSSNLYKYGSAIFGDEVSIEAFASEGYVFDFSRVESRRLPVLARLDGTIEFKDQYMAAGPISLTPDSITVYGAPRSLAKVDVIRTKPIFLREVGAGGSRGRARLDIPSGLEVRDKDRSVFYSLESARYVEMVETCPVEVRGVPEGMEIAVVPMTVKAAIKYRFPMDETMAMPTFYVDYQEFAESITGCCMIHWTADVAGVLDVSVSPEVCDCIALSI